MSHKHIFCKMPYKFCCYHARDYLLIPGGTGVLPGTEAYISTKDIQKTESRDRLVISCLLNAPILKKLIVLCNLLIKKLEV